MANPAVSIVGLHGDGVGLYLGAETLEASERGFSVRFVRTVGLRITKGEPDCIHIFGHGSRSWVGWRCRLDTTATVTATTTAIAGAASTAATTLVVPAGRLLVMNVDHVLN